VADVVEKGGEVKAAATKKFSNVTAAAGRAGQIAGETFEHLGSDVNAIVDQSKNVLNNDSHN
jgi:hypothetical protein